MVAAVRICNKRPTEGVARPEYNFNVLLQGLT